MTTRPAAPTVERERGPRRAAAFAAVGVVALALITGGTYAAWTDSEWAGPGSYDVPAGTRYNLLIASDETEAITDSVAGVTWIDTSADDTGPDGAFESTIESRVTLPSAAALSPATEAFATRRLYLKNDSSFDSSLVMTAVDLTGSDEIQEYVTFHLTARLGTVDQGSVTWETLVDGDTTTAGLSSGINLVSADTFEPGQIVEVELGFYFDRSLDLASNSGKGDAAKIAAGAALEFDLEFAGTSLVTS
jgi:predicted ribosomally synthesized peptide with SipW-like signal peptide